MLDGSYWFECYCYDDEHTIRFTLDNGEHDDEPPEIYTSIFMDTGGFFRRVKLGIKYIFGYKCRYGHFGNWTLCKEDLSKLESMVKDYSNVLKEYNLKNK